jgi:hypothetical protein
LKAARIRAAGGAGRWAALFFQRKVAKERKARKEELKEGGQELDADGTDDTDQMRIGKLSLYCWLPFWSQPRRSAKSAVPLPALTV